MVKRRRKDVNLSVLNTDSYDRRKFESVFERSEELKKIERNQKFPHFSSLMGDMWASLFKMKPLIKNDDEFDRSLTGNKAMMEHVMSDEYYDKVRPSTKLDTLLSSLATIRFTEKVSEWIEDQRKKDEEFKKLIEALQEAKKSTGKGRAERIRTAEGSLQEALKKAIENNGEGISKIFKDSVQEAEQLKDSMENLLGNAAGRGKAELTKVPLADKLKMAEVLKHNPKMKSISEWVGRFKAITRKKKRNKHVESLDRNGVSIGNKLEDLLPAELLMYSSNSTRIDFLRRFAEEQTLMYDRKGKEKLGKGPIIICLDQSGSMRNKEEISKAYALALISIARKQHRDFAYIPFGDYSKKYVYPKGKITVNEIVEIATRFLGGGTNFQRPLEMACDVINSNRFSKADVIFITDGIASISSVFKDQFKKIKAKKDFNMLSLIIKSSETHKDLVQISDKIEKISDFMDDAALKAFDI